MWKGEPNDLDLVLPGLMAITAYEPKLFIRLSAGKFWVRLRFYQPLVKVGMLLQDSEGENSKTRLLERMHSLGLTAEARDRAAGGSVVVCELEGSADHVSSVMRKSLRAS